MSARFSLMLCGALAAAVLAGAQAAAGQAASGDIFPYKVHETTLDNGLDVVVIPYDSPGTVAYYLIVRTGSRDEVEPGHSGFAHFFEHMMFRGTEKYTQDRYNGVLKKMGVDSNANTTDDRTVYHMVGPAAELETMMDMESDRFQNLKYAEDAFKTESLAVLGEYNKSVSNPIQPMFEKLRDLAFTKHTYKHTTIGFLDDIKAMPSYYEYSLGFFNRFYRPENTTLLVVGDVKPDNVVALAKKYYGSWKKGYQTPKVEPEPPQTEAKTAHLDWPNPVRPHLIAGYHAPEFSTNSTDWVALDLIGQLLFSESAPLYQELVVQKQWVDFIGGGPNFSRDPSLFMIFTRVKSEDLVPKVQETVDRYLQQLGTQPVDPARLDRIKSYLRYAFALSLDTPGNVAEQAAEAISASGDVNAINQRFALYQKVTPADIQKIAKEVFRPQNSTTVTLSHKAAEKPAAGAQGAAQGGAGHE
ncbi:MAG TPA: pitrilysin family protein [Thermoanaerobaculia bacterium]|nr:pitrilysin family protein [Thermoanaerobaculia bacterium]